MSIQPLASLILVLMVGAVLGGFGLQGFNFAQHQQDEFEDQLGEFTRSANITDMMMSPGGEQRTISAEKQLTGLTTFTMMKSIHCVSLLRYATGRPLPEDEDIAGGHEVDPARELAWAAAAVGTRAPAELTCPGETGVMRLTGYETLAETTEWFASGQFVIDLTVGPVIGAMGDAGDFIGEFLGGGEDDITYQQLLSYDDTNDAEGRYGNYRFTYPETASDPMVIDAGQHVVKSQEMPVNPPDNGFIPFWGESSTGNDFHMNSYFAPDPTILREYRNDRAEERIIELIKAGASSDVDFTLNAQNIREEYACGFYPALPTQPVMKNVPMYNRSPIYGSSRPNYWDELPENEAGNVPDGYAGTHLRIKPAVPMPLFHRVLQENYALVPILGPARFCANLAGGRFGGVTGSIISEIPWEAGSYGVDWDAAPRHTAYSFIICPGTRGVVQSDAARPGWDAEAENARGKDPASGEPDVMSSTPQVSAGENVVYPFVKVPESAPNDCVTKYEDERGESVLRTGKGADRIKDAPVGRLNFIFTVEEDRKVKVGTASTAYQGGAGQFRLFIGSEGEMMPVIQYGRAATRSSDGECIGYGHGDLMVLEGEGRLFQSTPGGCPNIDNDGVVTEMYPGPQPREESLQRGVKYEINITFPAMTGDDHGTVTLQNVDTGQILIDGAEVSELPEDPERLSLTSKIGCREGQDLECEERGDLEFRIHKISPLVDLSPVVKSGPLEGGSIHFNSLQDTPEGGAAEPQEGGGYMVVPPSDLSQVSSHWKVKSREDELSTDCGSYFKRDPLSGTVDETVYVFETAESSSRREFELYCGLERMGAGGAAFWSLVRSVTEVEPGV